MNELYFKDPDTGQLVPDRRSTNNMEIQQAVLKLLAKVESMETNIETKLEAVKDKIGNIDEKLSNRVNDIEKKLENHCDDEGGINDVLNEHDKKLEAARGYVERIHKLESKYTILEGRVDELEKKPIKSKAAVLDDFFDITKKVLFTAIATGLVGFLGYLLITYLK